MNQISYENKDYTIYTVTKKNYKKYETILDNLLICDNTFISNVLENSIYTSIQDGGMTGFFLTDNKNIMASVIVDKKCSQNSDFIKENGYPLQNSIEITLVCANQSIRVAGLTTLFVKYIIQGFIPSLKDNVRYLFLYVAKGNKNTRAISFYKKIGFKLLKENRMIYEINL